MSSFPQNPLPSVAVKVSITPQTAVLELGENTLALSASLVDAYGDSVEPSVPFTWQSSNNSLATVSSGLVTSAAIADPNALFEGGQVSVSCTYPYGVTGTIQATAIITVTVPEAYSGHVVLIDPSGTNATFGSVRTFGVEPWDGGNPVIGG
jgi:uncharacterized protein YjdB